MRVADRGVRGGERGNVESVVGVSKDGSRVYFVAQGVLADNLGVDSANPGLGDVGASTGANNLYVWQRDSAHPAGTTRFVARLGTNDMPREGLTPAQMTPDGRYLLFFTANRLVAGDTDNRAVDAYRYDVVSNTFVRVSKSVAGDGGNAAVDVALIPGGRTLVPGGSSLMSADGSTVIFDTTEALSLADTDGVADVYSWHDGQVSLISAGGGNSIGITPSGRDIFFYTAKQLMGFDGDFNSDIYDARIGGGFVPVLSAPCTGNECRGPQSLAPSVPEPLSGGSGDGGRVEVTPVFSLRSISAAQRKALARTGRVSLSVTANVPGTIGVKRQRRLLVGR